MRNGLDNGRGCTLNLKVEHPRLRVTKKLVILDSKRERFSSSIKILVKIYNFLMSLYFSLIYSFFVIPTVKRELKKGETKVIAADFATEKRLKEHGIDYAVLKDYINKEEYKKYCENAIKLVRAIPKRDKSFKKVVDYNGISMWNMNELDVNCAFFEPIITDIGIIESVIEKEKPQSIVILNSASQLGKIQKLVAEKEGLRVVDKTDFISKIKSATTEILTPLVIKTIHSEFLRKIKHGNNEGRKPRDIIFYSRSKKSINYAMPFLKELNNVTILQNEDSGFEDSNGIKFEKMENYVEDKLKKNIKNFRYRLKLYWKKAKKSKEFKQNFKYKDISLYPLLKGMLGYLFSIGFLESVFYYEVFDNFVKKAKPKLLITIDEFNKSSKTLVYYSVKNGIKSLMIQHGLIVDEPCVGTLKAMRLAVFGNFTKKVLKKRGTNPNKIKVVGQPRFDDLINKKYDKKKIYSILNIPLNKPIIVFASSPGPVEEERYELSYNVIKSMKPFPNHQLVIKLHPDDKFDLYRKLVKKIGINAKIVKDVDLYGLLSVCSLIISPTPISTIILEAMILNKPLINVNLTGAPDKINYSGVVLGVHKKEELVPAIRSILEDKKTQEQLKKARKKYVYEHAYKQDGKATERVVKLIESIIKKQKIKY